MSASRSKNATLNIAVGWGAQAGILLLSFLSRRIFVQFLSADYLGINGLYGNILSVLALAELGLGHVTQYFLYKPVAQKDHGRVASLVRYFRKLYTFIALAVLALGLLLIPFLQFIINSDLNQNELILYYLIFLLNSCVTYFAADRIALLAANQDNRLTKYITLAVNIGLQLLHILVLVLWHNYMVYVLATLFSSLVNVLVTNWLTYRRYPYLRERSAEKVEIDKKYIINNLKSTFIYKIGATIINNTDNILISIMVSTAAVGLYSNYFMVVSGIQTFLTVVTTSLISGIGNLSASGDKKRMGEVFGFMLLFYHFIAAFCGVCFFLLFNDFIPLWLGEGFLLDQWTVFAIALSFYIINAISPIWMFREANGLFGKVKYLLLVTALFNLIFSVFLGRFLGVFGILIATSLARIFTVVWFEPRILFKNVFQSSSKTYWYKQLRYLALSLVAFLPCAALSYLLPHSFVFILIKGVLFFALFAAVFSVGCFKTNEFGEVLKIIKKLTRRVKR